MLTRLRRIASCFFFTLLVLAIWLWVRSYFYSDVAARMTGYSQATSQSIKGAIRGEIYSGQERFYTYTKPVYQFRSRPAGRGSLCYDNGFMNFYWKHHQYKQQHRIEYRLPIWPIVLFLMTATVALRPKPRLRYGLFDLMAVLTMIALAVGALFSLTDASGLFSP